MESRLLAVGTPPSGWDPPRPNQRTGSTLSALYLAIKIQHPKIYDHLHVSAIQNDSCSHWYVSHQAGGPMLNTDTFKVLFKFRQDAGQEIRNRFLKEIKTLKLLPCVKRQRLVVGGPSVTDPLEKSKGFHYCLLSYHENLAALAEYQASSEHER